MIIRHLFIQNFRGIKELDWDITQSVVCLIGQGDSTKSTILDAINVCLSHSWFLNFSDADFFNCDITNPIKIITTIGGLPDQLIKQEKFGNHIRGWSIENGLVDEPENNTEPVLSIELNIDESLEPKWSVINDRDTDGIFISANDRRKLGVTSLGMYVDHELSWGKQSALSQLTGNDEEISSVLANANRSAREAVASASLTELTRSAEIASEIAKEFGVKPQNQYLPGLDAKLSVSGQSTITLHDDKIPVRMTGLGSRRLLVLAIQQKSVPEGGIMLIDEIESGLEPHRLRHLIRKLRPIDNSSSQVFLTTHSSVAIEELNAEELFIVQNICGKTEIHTISQNLQALIRKTSEAFLANKIIACEGATEVGFIRGLDQYWQTPEGGTFPPFACLGIVPITSTGGGGSEMADSAIQLKKLGYQVTYFGDSDVPIVPPEEELRDSGINVLVWENSKCIEERICLDIPFNGLNDFLNVAVDCVADRGKPANSVYDSIGAEFHLNSGGFKGNVLDLLELGNSEELIREIVGRKANENKWFKRISYGEQLTKIVIKYLEDIENSDLANKIIELNRWANE